jgi:hypothetical protein
VGIVALFCKDPEKVAVEGLGRLRFPDVAVGAGVRGKWSERALRLILTCGLPVQTVLFALVGDELLRALNG